MPESGRTATLMPVSYERSFCMKKTVLWLWIWVFVMVKYLCDGIGWMCREMADDIQPHMVVTFIKAVGFLCAGVAGIGMVGVFMAVMK